MSSQELLILALCSPGELFLHGKITSVPKLSVVPNPAASLQGPMPSSSLSLDSLPVSSLREATSYTTPIA